MKKYLTLLLVAALAVTTLAACGKTGGDKTGGDKASPTEETSVADVGVTAVPDPAPHSDAPVEWEPEGYTIVCELAKDPDNYQGQTYDFPAREGSGDIYEEQPLLIRATDAAGNEQFSFLAWLWCVKGVTDLWDRENVSPYPAHLAARRGTAWLFTVGTEPEENSSWLLYDEDAKELRLLGVYSRALTLGDGILLHTEDYTGEFGQPLEVYDWAGLPSGTYQNVIDFRVSGDALYLLAGKPSRLQRVPTAKFTRSADITAETLCSLTGFSARFSYEEGQEDMMRLTPEGENELSCPIAETPLYVGGLEGENLKATGRVKESCNAFTVTLPDYWEGKYVCEKEPDGMYFRHKHPGATDEAQFGELLFSLTLNDIPDDVERYMNGDSAYELCRLYRDGIGYDVSLFEPGPTGCDAESQEEYLAMRAALLGSPLYRMEEHIGAAAGGRVEQYDYTGLIAEYSGEDEIGSTYRLTVASVRRNVLLADINWYPAGDPIPADIATAEIRMFGDEGTIYWEQPNAYYEEGVGYSAAYGDGYFRVQDDGSVLFRMNAMGDSWTNTGDLTLTRR